ncbi:MAG: DUF4252 domain-containing protein [Bacteroidota bacterium]
MKTKINIILIVLTFVSCTSFGKSDGYDKFYKIYKKHNTVINFDIPTVILGIYLNYNGEKELSKFIKKSDDFKIFRAKGSKTYFLPILNEYLPDDTYKDNIIVKEPGSIVTFKTKEAENVITEIILIVEEGNDLTAISIKGKFTANELIEYINTLDVGKVTDTRH